MHIPSRAVGLLCAATLLGGCSAASTPQAGSSSDPGVSATKVSVGAIVTQSGYGAADFGSYVFGLRAYFDYVNSLGGIDHRRLSVAHVLDDQSSSTNNVTDAQQLVLTDHVFAVFVSSIFFGASGFLAKQGTPTFGYATDTSWRGHDNLFADYGSVLDYASTTPDFAFVAHRTHSLRAALLAYGVPQSSGVCEPALADLPNKYGVKVAFSDLNVNPILPNFTVDVIKMRAAHVDLVVNCMDYSAGLALSSLMRANHMTPTQVWLDGYDTHVAHSSSVLPNTYIVIQHVPFEATVSHRGAFPGLELYLAWMARAGYGAHAHDDVALMGWESGHLFAAGLRAAGEHPTWPSVISAINRIRDDTGGGVSTPTDWTTAHDTATPPSCSAFVVVVNPGQLFAGFAPAFGRGTNPWVCFPLTGTIDVNRPVAAPAGSPGA
jgi:ABC-type branched-subunit amino acid transport system substrate-binding protein